jgi:GR25 family glycosyltransferase involved in LPS biosynthesis
MENIGKVYYINIDHRLDRKEQILKELDTVGITSSKVERISAIYKKGFGILGCGLSHKKAVEQFIESKEDYCIIFEDDFVFTIPPEEFNFLLGKIFSKKMTFDVIMLSGLILQQENTPYYFLKKVNDGHAASAYILSRQFAPTLLENYTEATQKLEETFLQTGEKKIQYHQDMHWKYLQKYCDFYILNPVAGIQRESYSDVQGRPLLWGF